MKCAEDCPRRATRRGLCNKHYMRLMRHGTAKGGGFSPAGTRFGNQVLVEDRTNDMRKVKVKCDCGSVRSAVYSHLVSGRSSSCGHGIARHGRSGTPEYTAWRDLKKRCLNPLDGDYPNYGGRGIRVCDEWVNSFEAFYEHIGPKPSPDMSVDRIDNDGNYEPGNVRWATATEQRHNQRRMQSTGR